MARSADAVASAMKLPSERFPGGRKSRQTPHPESLAPPPTCAGSPRDPRGYIGATIQNFTPESAEALGLGDQKGAIVADLSPGGPSAKAGLQVGDVVITVNGTAVKSSTELTRQVARVRAGDVLRLEVIREGKKRPIDIRSGVRPSERDLASNDNTPGGPGGRAPAPGVLAKAPVLGMSVGTLDETARTRLNLPPEGRGPLGEPVEQTFRAGVGALIPRLQQRDSNVEGQGEPG
eukprot:gene2046-2755_t